MNKSDLKDYLAKGYEVSPFQIEDIEDCIDINPVILDKKVFLKHLNNVDNEIRFSLMCFSNSFVVYKVYIDEPIHITPAILLKRIKDFKNELSKGLLYLDNILDWINSLDKLYNQKKCYFPSGIDFINEKLRLIYLPDYMFNNDDHLVSYILYRLKSELNEKNYEIELDNAITFIQEILDMKEEKESYSLSEISLAYILTVTKYLKGDEYHTLMDDNFRRMYQSNLPLFANNSDIPLCAQELGENYFYPRFDFKKDLAKAETYYLKAYQLCPSSYLALRLGDIYDALDSDESIVKAYQYYSISYLCDQNNEATYKLADLLSLGRGVDSNTDLALDLLFRKINDLIEDYRLNKNSDLIHFATRLGIMYLNNNDNHHYLNEAEKYLLLARGNFKERYHIDREDIDIGYITIIEKNIDFMKRHIHYSNRRLSTIGGYILNKNTYLEFEDVEVKCIKDEHNYYHLIIKNKDNSPTLIGFNEIFLSEKVEVAHFIIKTKEEEFSPEDLDNVNSLLFSSGMIYYTDSVSKLSDFIDIEELIYRPNFDYSSLHNVVSLYSSVLDETYYFLTNRKYDINSKVTIYINDEKINTVVKDNLLLYEDELPFFKDDLIDLTIVTKK